MEQELGPTRLEAQRAEQPRPARTDVHRTETTVRDDEQSPAVRLHEVGSSTPSSWTFVPENATSGAAARDGVARGPGRRPGADPDDPAAEAPRPDERERLLLDVSEEGGTAVERPASPAPGGGCHRGAATEAPSATSTPIARSPGRILISPPC